MDGSGAIAFGDFRLDLASESLERDGVPVALTPKAYILLRHFLDHPGRLLTKDDLLDAVWPDTAVSDAVLACNRPRPARGSVQAPIVNCLAFLAMATWFRGKPDTAIRLTDEARRVAEELAHPSSMLWASHVTAILHHLRGEPAAAATAAEVAVRLATELGLRQWIAWGVFFHGWLATLEGELDRGLAAMHSGLDEYLATGAELGRVYLTATLAEAHGRAGQAERGLALIDESLALATARSERYYAAELHRLRAGLLSEPMAAEAELRRAVTLAGQQGNRALALRAATDLAARLGGAAGRRALTPIYARFREGLDTADVRAARTTLAGIPKEVTRVTTRRRSRP